MKLKVFLFHRVHPVRDPLWDPMSPEHFEEVVKYLSKKYAIVPLEETLLENSKALKKPAAAIVFDDGYKDYLEYALPILNKYNCPSSMYIVTDCADSGQPPWTFILDAKFANTSQLNIELNASLLPENLKQTSWSSTEERLAYGKQFKPFLKTLPDSQRRELYQQICDGFSDVSAPEGLMMNWDEIRQISDAGCHIGSHTCSHPLLAKIEDSTILEQELTNSGVKLEKELGAFPTTISYPIGSYNAAVKTASQKAGYKVGLAVDQVAYHSAKQDLLQVPRIELYNESMLKTKLRINGTLQTAKKMLGR